MSDPETLVFSQKSFWKCHRLVLIVAGIFLFLCLGALAEDWSGRGGYLIPPLPAVLLTVAAVVIGFLYHRNCNLTVTLQTDALCIDRFSRQKLIPWQSIRNIRHTAEGLDLTFGALFLSKFIVFEHDGKDVEIPTHKLNQGQMLHDSFSRFYFGS